MERIKRIIGTLTYDERKKRKMRTYTEKVERYRNMSTDELGMNYVEIITMYEHRRNIFVTALGTLLLSIIMDIWQYFFKLVSSLTTLMYESTADAEIVARASLMTTYTISAVVILVILLIFFDIMREMKKAIEDKVFVEYFMKEMAKGNDK